MNYIYNQLKKLNEKIDYLTLDFKYISKSNLNYLWYLNFRTLSRNRLGQCDFNKKLIEINKDYLEIRPLMEFKNTLRHEVAHAVVFEKYIFSENWKIIKPHGKEWQEIAKTLGVAIKCNSKKYKNRPKFNYWLECPIHGVVNSWIKKPSWFESAVISDNADFFICEICKKVGISNKLQLIRKTSMR